MEKEKKGQKTQCWIVYKQNNSEKLNGINKKWRRNSMENCLQNFVDEAIWISMWKNKQKSSKKIQLSMKNFTITISINLQTCLSFCSCFVIASLRRFWLLESSELFESACLELAEPKQPIADQGAHQQADDVPPSGDVSGDSVVPRASPLRASININFQCISPPSHLFRDREKKKRSVMTYCFSMFTSRFFLDSMHVYMFRELPKPTRDFKQLLASQNFWWSRVSFLLEIFFFSFWYWNSSKL